MHRKLWGLRSKVTLNIDGGMGGAGDKVSGVKHQKLFHWEQLAFQEWSLVFAFSPPFSNTDRQQN